MEEFELKNRPQLCFVVDHFAVDHFVDEGETMKTEMVPDPELRNESTFCTNFCLIL